MSSDDRETTEDGCSELNTVQPQQSELQKELQHLLNRHSVENGSGTPDFILANFMLRCLLAFEVSISSREMWYGRKQDRFGMPVGRNING